MLLLSCHLLRVPLLHQVALNHGLLLMLQVRGQIHGTRKLRQLRILTLIYGILKYLYAGWGRLLLLLLLLLMLLLMLLQHHLTLAHHQLMLLLLVLQ